MKTLKFITIILVLTSLKCPAQTSLDKIKIYQTVIKTFPDKRLSIVNETISRIYNYDIDGDYNKWFYQRNKQISVDTFERVVNIVSTNPIMYSKTVLDFLRSKNIPSDPSNLLHQANEVKLDSLSKYFTNDRIISWKKAPIANSFLANLFKKRKAIGLSNIIFDQQNKIALVKLQVFTKKNAASENHSWIFVLNKIGIDWEIIGSLDEK